MKAKEVKGEL